MKIISRHLLIFFGLATLWTILFRWRLSEAIAQEDADQAVIVAIFYGLAMGLSGFLTGRANGTHQFFADLGLRWNLATYIAWGLVSELWFAIGNPSSGEQAEVVHWTLLLWGIGIALHAIVFLIINRNRNIRGLQKSEIFE